VPSIRWCFDIAFGPPMRYPGCPPTASGTALPHVRQDCRTASFGGACCHGKAARGEESHALSLRATLQTAPPYHCFRMAAIVFRVSSSLHAVNLWSSFSIAS
jgi:hypothetical protein